MAFKKVVTLSTDKAIQLGGKDAPTSVLGYYLGAKNVESDFGPGKLHVFQTAEGNIGVWGKSNLNAQLSEGLIGQMCQVQFSGMGKAQKGRKPPYLFTVEHDEDDTIDVSSVTASSASEEPDYGDNADGEVGEEETYADEVPVKRASPPKTPASAPDAARTARVSALLNGTRRTNTAS